jgi:hypothetical protein
VGFGSRGCARWRGCVGRYVRARAPRSAGAGVAVGVLAVSARSSSGLGVGGAGNDEVGNPRGAGTRRFQILEPGAQPRSPQGKTLRCASISLVASVRRCACGASGQARERRSREAGSTAAGGRASEGRTPGGHSVRSDLCRLVPPLRRDQPFEADGVALVTPNGKEGPDLETGLDLRREQSPEGESSGALPGRNKPGRLRGRSGRCRTRRPRLARDGPARTARLAESVETLRAGSGRGVATPVASIRTRPRLRSDLVSETRAATRASVNVAVSAARRDGSTGLHAL